MGRDLNGKVVVFTGAASGVGQATAELAASRGAICYLSDAALEGVQTVAEDIRASGGEAVALGCDVTSHQQIGQFVEEVLTDAGRIDCLVKMPASFDVN